MLDICKDIERWCPHAILLNYTNPMAMQIKSCVKPTGLCYSVQGTAHIAHMLASWINASMDEITYLCAGINHQAWFIKFEWNGKDAYPLLREAVKRKKFYNHE